MGRAPLLIALCLTASCMTPAAPPSEPSPAAPAAPQADPGRDVLHLGSGERVSGRIVEETPRSVSIDRGEYVSTYPRSSVVSIDYRKDRAAPGRPLPDAEPAPVQPPTSWLPRRHDREAVEQTEVLFYDSHEPADCLGADLAKMHLELPDIALFADPGGKLRIHDPKRWGYHAHLAPQALRVPQGKPGLTIDVPKEEGRIPEWLTLVSPAQEVRVAASEEGGKAAPRSSYALPDVLHARLRPLGASGAMLASQAFSGGKPATTPNGTMWAFTLPRNNRQFIVYLLDPEKRHGEILNASYIGYGDTLLAADLMVDTVGADGVTRGRVLVVPYPDSVNADGPGVEPLIVYAGPLQDPTTIVRLALPPREAVQMPAKAASTRADVLVSHYDVSRHIPQSIVLAHGTGRPTQGMTLKSRELTPEAPDEIVKIDLTALPEERFPAVAWFYQRRVFHWRWTGGRLGQSAPPTAVPPGSAGPLKRVKRHDSIAHLVPLLFTGPKPPAASSAARGAGPGAGVAGGMANALLQSSLGRAWGGGGSTGNLAPATGSAPVSGGGESGPISNITYVYITAPPHVPSGDVGGGGYGGGGGMTGQYLSTYGTSGVGQLPGGYRSAFSPMPAMGTINQNSGQISNSQGNVVYDPQTGAVQQQGGGNQQEMYVDQGGNVNVRVNRRNGP